MVILEVEHLKKTYTTRLGSNRVEALRDVNFNVEQGEFVAIMGESGSGKTTLLNLLAALDKPTGGQIRLNGKNLGNLLEKYPYEVSGGQKQRAAVARALITDPRLVLADEPSGALDSHAADALMQLFEEINQEGQTIVMVTHSVKAACAAKRVLFIKDGEVFHQLYRGNLGRDEMYQKISDTLTIIATGCERHE